VTELDTGTPELLAALTDGVAVLTLNRPERRNALTPGMLDALAVTLARVEADPSVGAVVLTGAGGAFCAGGDVKAMAEGGSVDPQPVREQRQRLSQRRTTGALWHMAKPTLAALPGAAAGAGLSLALACDLRVAADSAVLTTAFAKVGLSGDYGSAWFLTRLVGTARARELLYLSDRLAAQEALALGLVNRVVPAESVQAEALGLARRLAAGPRLALARMKENCERAVHAGFDDYSDVEVSNHLRSADSDDHREAAQAFVEKREPRFQGR
jgi:2-(1,2-epoxy-1,2-dihydrophenyl)acetyl-CoA isomerase